MSFVGSTPAGTVAAVTTEMTAPVPWTKGTKLGVGAEGVVTCCGIVKFGVSTAGVTTIVVNAGTIIAVVPICWATTVLSEGVVGTVSLIGIGTGGWTVGELI